ncbi:hypothetical protein F4818DRAFT_239418 [Hypoxylon cercidicola]|nr:hypothetical protein F4818DRAFT_239418 [Hypoxylon cercidicola]
MIPQCTIFCCFLFNHASYITPTRCLLTTCHRNTGLCCTPCGMNDSRTVASPVCNSRLHVFVTPCYTVYTRPQELAVTHGWRRKNGLGALPKVHDRKTKHQNVH